MIEAALSRVRGVAAGVSPTLPQCARSRAMGSRWVAAIGACGLLAATLLASGAFAANGQAGPGIEPPKNLDRKGFFVLAPAKARELRVKSAATSEWRYVEGGRLQPRPGAARAEYDEAGRLVRFSGPLDEGGDADIEYRHDGEGRLVEEAAYSKSAKSDSARELVVKFTFDLSQPGRKEQSVHDRSGALVARTRFTLDAAGRITKLEKLDVGTGRVVASAQRSYDSAGNFTEEYGEAGRKTHTLEKNVLTVSNYAGPRVLLSKGRLHSSEQYTFDAAGNLLSYHRQSGDGSFWDRYTYKLDERGLPLEKIWSRLEYVRQDPYALTRYSYEFYP